MNLEWLEQAAQLTIVLGFCGAIFNHVALRPLNLSIQRLGEIIVELRNDLKNNDKRLTQLEVKVAKLEHLLSSSALRKEAST